MSTRRVVGQSVPMTDAREKLTGAALFGVDVVRPGMLVGRLLRSPYPHARLCHIDPRRALALKGVHLVATAAEAPARSFGLLLPDERLFAASEVLYVGDEVAGIVADDQETAREALDLIEVDYEPLPAVLDPLEAVRPGAPLARLETSSNICHRGTIDRGDVERGFASAAIVLEQTYTIPYQHQAYLEPHTATAEWAGDRLTLWAPHQSAGPLARMVEQAFGLPAGNFRFLQTYIGGAFGGKSHMRVCLFAALLARLAGRPVQITLDRDEDFASTMPSVPMTIRLKMGAAPDGEITAKEIHVVADNGAFSGYGPSILDVCLIRVDALYRLRNVRARGSLVYTNKVPSSAMRGYGNTEAHFAVESMMDSLAEALGIDPVAIRLLNAAQPGDVTVHGWKINSCGLTEAIHAAAQDAAWDSKRGRMRSRRRGVGLACGIHVSGNRALSPAGDGSRCQVTIFEDGSVHLASAEGDLGQGSKTIFAQIAAEELGLPYGSVQVSQLDTDTIAGGVGCIASRTTVLGGHAVRLAAEKAREALVTTAAHKWGCPPEDVQLSQGRLVNLKSEEEMTIAEAATHYLGMSGGSRLLGEGCFRAEGVVVPDATKYGNVSLAYAFAAQVAEVEVDIETGAVTVLRLVAAHDAGVALNPRATRGQIEGGMIQGMGKALYEEYVFKDGAILNPNFTDYRVPTILDVPPMKALLVETEDLNGPYGAKSVGELALVPTPAAIANAIYDAVGVRLTTLPMTPERVLEALRHIGPSSSKHSV